MMGKIKRVAHLLLRYLKSFKVYLIIIFKSFFSRKDLNALFQTRFETVHILCPGPSAKKIIDHKIEKNECVIFINHALKMVNEININQASLFYFTSDGTRLKESVHDNLHELMQVKSIIFASHLFHFNLKLINKCDIFFVPKIEFSKEFGVVGQNNGPNSFSKIQKTPIMSGFGSMINSLQLAVLFQPKTIKLWGCDMLDVKNERYFDTSVPIRKEQKFDLTKNHFEIITPKINALGISIIQ